MENRQTRMEEVHKALAEFIVNATKKDAPSYAVQALPEAVKAFAELNGKLSLCPPSTKMEIKTVDATAVRSYLQKQSTSDEKALKEITKILQCLHKIQFASLLLRNANPASQLHQSLLESVLREGEEWYLKTQESFPKKTRIHCLGDLSQLLQDLGSE